MATVPMVPVPENQGMVPWAAVWRSAPVPPYCEPTVVAFQVPAVSVPTPTMLVNDPLASWELVMPLREVRGTLLVNCVASSRPPVVVRRLPLTLI